jgi:uncharacterized protein
VTRIWYQCSGAFAALVIFTFGALPLSAESGRAVKSLLEMRRENVVVQEWDLSCGAAALTTILNYQHGDPVTEREVALSLIKRDEYIAQPELVTIRQGFSLLDLKRFVDGRGYKGVGLGKMTLENLVERAPVIVPIETHGYNHFVVFRGIVGNRVVLADPAWGNRTMLTAKFERAWIDYGEIGKVGFVVERTDGLTPPNALAVRPEDALSLQ